MKKILICVLCLMFWSPIAAFALGSWSSPTYAIVQDSSNFRVGRTFTITWTGDAANGTVPNYTFTSADREFMKGYYIYAVQTNPGTAPTDNYDMTILNADGLDIMGTALNDRDKSNTELAIPKCDGTNYCYPLIDGGTLTLTVANNTDVSATCTLKIYLVR